MNKFEKSNPHTTKASNTKLKPIIFGPPNAKTLNSKSKFWAPKKIEEKKEYDFLIFPRNQHKINLNQHKTQPSETQRLTTHRFETQRSTTHRSETQQSETQLKPLIRNLQTHQSTTSDLYFCFIARNPG